MCTSTEMALSLSNTASNSSNFLCGSIELLAKSTSTIGHSAV